jgi:hypothetical protein
LRSRTAAKVIVYHSATDDSALSEWDPNAIALTDQSNQAPQLQKWIFETSDQVGHDVVQEYSTVEIR